MGIFNPPSSGGGGGGGVTSVNTRTGAVTLAASDILSGTFDIARIPVVPSQKQVVSSGAIANLTTAQQEEIAQGTIVTTTDGRRWVYTGTGSKILEASYITLADVTPDWSAIDNKPTSFTPSAHASSHGIGGSDSLSPASIGAVAKTGDTMTGTLNVLAPVQVGDFDPSNEESKISINTGGIDLYNGAQIGWAGTGFAASQDSLRNSIRAAGTGVSNTFTSNQIVSTTSANTALRVTQLGTGESFRVEDSANPDTTAFVISNNGRVGVGVAPSSGVNAPAISIDGGGIKFEDGTIQTTAGSKSPQIDIFKVTGGVNSFTWNKPANAKQFAFECVGGGGGGGKGLVVVAGTAVSGGGGGGSGGYSRALISAADLPNTDAYSVVVGNGGAGGTTGNATAGTPSNVSGSTLGVFVNANGGALGAVGVATTSSTGGTGGAPAGNNGGSGNITAAGGNGSGQGYAPSSGGAGGGCSTTTPFNGGTSGAAQFILGGTGVGGIASTTGNGGNGAVVTPRAIPSLVINGSGGGGGGASTFAGASGGAGANATGFGCGGGGGGSVSAGSPTASGTGGNGGKGSDGIVVITSYF
jgi:hypothetical protein